MIRLSFWSFAQALTGALRSLTLALDCRARAYLADAQMREEWRAAWKAGYLR